MTSIFELRKANLRRDIDFTTARCMEIGALNKPIIQPNEGNILYADHLSIEGLKKQFAWDTTIKPEDLAPVSVIWQEKPLKDCVSGQFDYVIASHVGEHVPNLIGWINEIQEILKPNGELRLALPDGRFSFDAKRQLTRLSDLLAAWMKNLRCPDTHIVLDFALNKIDDSYAGLDLLNQDPSNLDRIKPQFPFSEVLMWGERTLDPNHYEDVHCWVLTPGHFAKLMLPLAQNDILKMACVSFVDTVAPGLEFIVNLSPEENREKRVASWKKLKREAKDLIPNSTQANLLHGQQNLQTQCQELQEEVNQLKSQLEAILHSHSWRCTAPLRRISKKFKR
ncbi:MAG: methyltransferase domain-containing protein [Commensalibacter sp.]|nr:methyltransferase domain-containing protein [Commensalibacter sp.]